MPELPEVETVRRQLHPLLSGRTVIEGDAFASPKFTPALDIIGAEFLSVQRRAKYLVVPTSDNRELILHLGMTGQLSVKADPDLSHRHLRAWWRLDDGMTLLYRDARRFGRLAVVPAGDYRALPTLHQAGPEPWDPALTPTRFHQLLSSSRRPIKTRLLTQRPIAGVGNIYADEALWLAQINPMAIRVGHERAERLLHAIRTVLQEAIGEGGTTLRDYRTVEGETGTHQHRLQAYGRAGAACLRCGTIMQSRVIDARTTHWCPVCQRR